MKYPVGTKFQTRGKAQKTCTVVDYHVTRSISGDVVRERYVAEHIFMGQALRDEYVQTTIDVGLIETKAAA